MVTGTVRQPFYPTSTPPLSDFRSQKDVLIANKHHKSFQDSNLIIRILDNQINMST